MMAPCAQALLAGLLGALLAGCGTQMQVVHVPVPVACDAQVPARPPMPTEALPTSSSLDAFVQAALAEIERREAYERELEAALQACTAPP